MRFGRETLGEIQGRSSPAWMKRSMLQGLCVTQEESDRDLWLSDLHHSLGIGKDAARRYREAGEGGSGFAHKQLRLRRATGLAYTCCRRIERC